MKKLKKMLSLVLSLCFVLTAIQIYSVPVAAAINVADGWYETLYAEWTDSNPAGATVEYKASADSAYTKADPELIRAKNSSTARVDIPGLKAGTYDIRITASNGSSLTKTGITVKEYDRSGYAHFGYTSGVGAYKDDGTLKANAKVIYVTEANKDTVSLAFPNDTSHVVTGIGNILNSRGAAGTSEGAANTNDNILRAYSQAGIPLDFRFIGKVTPPVEGLTAYDSVDYGGSVGDNGFMARMKDAKDVTIEGIGYDASIYGWGIHFMASSAYPDFGKSFEVRNITFDHYPEDALGMEGIYDKKGNKMANLTAPVERCWIHNNSFLQGYCANPAESDKKEGDGSCDFKRGMYYTLSYNYFENGHKTNLIGASEDNPQFNITFHHNYWSNCWSRMPLARTANIHIYNNYFFCVPETKGLSYIMSIRGTAYVFSESNFFEGCKNPVQLKNSGVVKSFNDTFYNTTGDNLATIVSDREATVDSSANEFPNFDTNSSVFYYDSLTKKSDCKMTDSVTAKADCIAYSGVMKETPTEPKVEPVVDVTPQKALQIPYSINFTQADAGARMTAAGVANLRGTNVEFENVIYNSMSDYKPGTTNGYLKSKGENVIVFKLDKQAKVTVKCASGAKLGVALYDSYGAYYTTAPVGGESSVNVPAGIYIIQCESSVKEAYIAGFAVDEYDPNLGGGGSDTPTPEIKFVAPGTYNIGTSYADADGDSETDCVDVAGTYGNITYNLVGIEADYGTVKDDNESYISFNVERDMQLTVDSEAAGVLITADNGKVNGGDSAALEAGKGTVTLTRGSYTITGASADIESKIRQLIFETYAAPETTTEAPTTTETTTEATTQSTPVDVGTPSGSNDGSCYVRDNKDGTYTLIDTSSSDTCVWKIPFAEQKKGKIVISGTVTLNQQSGKWAFIQVKGTDGTGLAGTEICAFGSDDSKNLALRTGGVYTPFNPSAALAANVPYKYVFTIDLDAQTVQLTVNKTLVQTGKISAESVASVYMQTAKSDTQRTVTADIPYVGILTDAAPETTTEATTTTVTDTSSETTTTTSSETSSETTTTTSSETSSETTTEEQGDTPLGDGNVDGGQLTANDAAIILAYVKSAGNMKMQEGWDINRADVNGDGIGADDAAEVLIKVLNPAHKFGSSKK